MATEAINREQVDRKLDLAKRMLSDLFEVIEEWEHMSSEEQVDWSLEWDQFISSVEHVLHKAYKSGRMTPEQIEQYRGFLSALKGLSPILHKMKLAQPHVSLAEVA